MKRICTIAVLVWLAASTAFGQAGTKLTALTDMGTNAAGEDLLYIVDDPSGSATSKKITITNLLGNLRSGIGFAADSTYNIGSDAMRPETIYVDTVNAPTVMGSTSSAGDLRLQSTSHATKGKVYFGSANNDSYDETTGKWTFTKATCPNPAGGSGISNECFGASAGAALTTGGYNVCLGASAGVLLTTGSSNVLIGSDTGSSATDATLNVLIGGTAGSSLTSGTKNTGVGHHSLRYITTGIENTAVGYASGYAPGAGSYNTMIGAMIGENQPASGDEDSCTAVGCRALFDVGAATSNCALGRNAGMGVTTGSYNTYLGMNTAYYNKTGANNTYVGFEAGKGAVFQYNSNNTVIGYRAGLALKTGGTNVFVGSQAGDSGTLCDNCIVIGYNQDLPTASTDNHLNIGGTIKGDLSALRTEFQGPICLSARTTLTLVSDVITVAKGYHLVAGQDGLADDLVTITDGTDGQMLVLRPSDGAVTITAKETGNLCLAGDFAMDNEADTLTLIYDSSLLKWIETSRSDNGA